MRFALSALRPPSFLVDRVGIFAALFPLRKSIVTWLVEFVFRALATSRFVCLAF